MMSNSTNYSLRYLIFKKRRKSMKI